MKPKKPMGRLEMHADTRLLISHLRQVFVTEKKDFISYPELTHAIGGRDVQKEAYSLMNTARKSLIRDDRVLLVAVPGEGLRREQDVAAFLGRTKQHIGKVSRSHSKQAICALEGEELPNEQRVQACLELSLLGAISTLTQPKARRQIEGKIAASAPKELPTAETLRAQFTAKGE